MQRRVIGDLPQLRRAVVFIKEDDEFSGFRLKSRVAHVVFQDTRKLPV
jgi:hypothetical protein